jgi:DNA-binding NtrC family response regulator
LDCRKIVRRKYIMGVSILLVDDEEQFTQVLSERMEARGYDVEIANSGPIALKKVKEKIYDAIILDLAMPEMDGIETLKKMVEENPDLQIIFLTGHATLQKGIEAVKLGAMDFLEKPVDLEELLIKVKQASEKRIMLYEKRKEEELKDILKKKSW